MPGPSAAQLFGPMLIGVFINTLLYGVLLVQAGTYLQTCKRDKPWIKCLVSYILLAETANTIFDIGTMYEPLVLRWGSTHALNVVPKLFATDAVTTVLVSTPVQLLMAWKIWVINKSRFLMVIICFLAIASFAGGIATTVSVCINPEFADFGRFDPTTITWLAGSAAADILITISLVWSLMTRKTGVSSIDHVINRIILFTVQTGMITACVATIDITVALTVQKSSLNFIFDFLLCKLYSNTIICSLNARSGWSGSMPNTGEGASSMLFTTDLGSGSSRVSVSHIHSIAPGSAKPFDLYNLPQTKMLNRDLESGTTSTRTMDIQGEYCAY